MRAFAIWSALERREVYGTTIVVIITVFFFGFYLYGLDVAMSYLAAALTRLVGA